MTTTTTTAGTDRHAFTAPLYVAWETTHRCNARCLHCYSASGPDVDRTGELSTQEALDVIDQLADAGVVVLAFSGGEPLLRRDWAVLVSRAVSRGLSVNIGTNGATVSERRADQLRELGVHSVTVSLDSHRPEVHDHFRRFPGLYRRTLNAIRRLVARDVRVVVGFTPTRLNWRDGPEVVALAARLGASAVNLSEYVPAGRGPLSLALTPQELRSVLHEWIDMRQAYRGTLDVIWHDCRVGMLVPDDERRKYVGCGAGRLVARIRPDGSVTPCVFLPTVIGGLREQPFRQMWTESELLAKFRVRQGLISGNCGECAFLATCGGCRAVAYAYSGGDPLAGDPHCWVLPRDPDPMAGLAAGESLPM
jgi:radical SAM protein with 4Fe4S-binding SPASM domain